jgi:uncharacterized membrane protein YhaH (DUF805 family)
MTFTDSISTCFKKYATFDGTASVSEFWWFFLFQILVSLVAQMLGYTISTIISLAMLLPALAVGCRRLHDTDRSGWWQLLALIPIIGWIVLVVFWVQDGKANRYGGIGA